jgi:hypothetical protein
MPQTVTYSGSAVADTGPALSFSRTIPLEGVNLIAFTLKTTESAKVDLGSTPAQLQFLLINPSAPSENITFTIDGKGTALKLDQPLILGSASAVSFLGNFKFLEVTNGDKDPVTIEIFVGRDPTS